MLIDACRLLSDYLCEEFHIATGICYWLEPSLLTWRDAALRCNSNGGLLGIIDSQKMQDKLIEGVLSQ